MQHFHSLYQVQLEGVWLTIGSFDGVHRGHQEIINKLTAEAHKHKASAVVLTFHPHPATIVRDRDFPFYLTSIEEKAELIGDLGVDFIITHPFSRELSATPAYDFMKIVQKQLNISHLKIGHDFALGRGREGNAIRLAEIGKKLGYSVQQINPYKLDNQIVSSSRIRFLLGAGQVKEASRLLNRNYSLSGKVIMGDQRGQTIGFPTANLDIWKMRAIPAAGVYVCKVKSDNSIFGGVTNIGVRPTFESKPVPPRVETHILNFDGDLYGKSLTVEFLNRLRGEQRFSTVDELINQINQDVKSARNILA